MPTKTDDAKATQRSAAKDGKARQMLATRHDMPEQNRRQMIDLLNQQLADVFDLYSLTKQAHWNVKGPEFFQLHELYDDLAETLLGHVDTIAERAVALGGVATGTVRMAAGASRLKDLPAAALGSLDSVRLLADCYAALARTTREAIDQAEQAEDMDTSDLFVEVSRDLDKALWFLEAHTQLDA